MNKTIPSQDLRWRNLKADPTCRKCGITKTIDDFPKRAVDYCCNSCRNEYAKEQYREKVSRMTPQQYKAFRERLNEKQKANRQKRIEQMTDDQREAYIRRTNAKNKERREAVRADVYAAYGGFRCACCGETEEAFLSIDHINNDGAEHRRNNRLQTGEQMHRWLKRNGYPEGFQVLCMNCQWGKRNNNGVCPHQVRCNDHSERK